MPEQSRTERRTRDCVVTLFTDTARPTDPQDYLSPCGMLPVSLYRRSSKD
jgi:hypothetical protein